MDDLFIKLLNETPNETKRFIAKSMDVSNQIMALLGKLDKNQRYLAEKLGKSESEISKWLSGNHNFTLRTLAKIESILGEDILVAPMYWNEYKGTYSVKEAEKASPADKHKSSLFHSIVSMRAYERAEMTVKAPREVAGEYQILNAA